jgi:PHD/YefM family antitoxin component YafN of YafNO toxin-antitoxin module
MKLDLENGIGSLTDFARKTRAHLEKFKETNQPRVLTQNGEAAAVVLSVKVFGELSQLAYEREMEIRLSSALEAHAKGERGTEAARVFERFRSREK